MQVESDYIQELIDSKIKSAEKTFGKDFKNALIEIISLEKMLNPVATQAEEKQVRLIPLAKWNNYHDFPTVSALRQYKFRSKLNGFEDVIEYGGENGNQILINENKFFVWYTNRKSVKTAS